MPMIHGRYYANPAYGRAIEQGREEERQESADSEASGRVHRIHIQHHPDGIQVRVLHHAPGSDEESLEPSGRFTTHHFEHDDHDGVGRFVAHVLSRR
jgi:hypothetical protein